MPKKDEVKIPKKVKEEMTLEIIDELNSTIKEEITETVVNDIKKSFDQDYKDTIKNDIKDEIIVDIKKDISKEQKKLTRSKSFKIFRLYIYLIIVVAALVYLLFRLYETDNLTVINEKYTKKVDPSNTTLVTTTTTEQVKDADYYIKNYGYLMNNIKISNVELVKGRILVSSMNMSDKLALAYANVDAAKIIVDGIIHTLNEEDLKSSYEELFGNLDNYSQSNFMVNELNYAYSSFNNSYMAIGEEKENGYVSNILVNGYEENGEIVLEAKAYIIRDGSVYNPSNMNYRITSVTENMDLTRIQNRLLSVEYRFAQGSKGYNLVSIVRK